MLEEVLVTAMIIAAVIAIYGCVMIILESLKDMTDWDEAAYEAARDYHLRQSMERMMELERKAEELKMQIIETPRFREVGDEPPSVKPFNQAVKADAGKLRLSLVPPEAIEDIAEVREYGARKYKDPDNWKCVEIARYRDALFRHLLAYLRDPKGKDSESGIEHYKHLICNAAFICALERENKDG